MVVVDASVVVALIVDDGPAGRWAEAVADGERLAAPHLLPAEVANVLRRTVARRLVAPEVAALALGDLADLDIELFPFAPFSARVWELRDSVSAYDAWYVSLAELLEVPLATLDTRLARSPQVRCTMLLPDS